MVKANLTDLGVVKPMLYAVGPGLEAFGVSDTSEAGSTFEQRKELLLLQTEKLAVAKLSREAEIITLLCFGVIYGHPASVLCSL